MSLRGSVACILGLVALALVPPSAAFAQSWARFDVPDSLLLAVVRTSGAQYESSWNSLLVATLRAEGGPADSLRRLRGIARRVAAAEQAALASSIASDALSRTQRWSRAQRRVRVAAAVEESLATASQSAREYERADSLFRAALGRYRELGERRREAWVLGSLGVVAFLSGDLVRADSVYRIALEARRALGDPKMIGNTLNVIGSTNYLLGRDSTARAFLEQAREVRERTGELAALGATRNYLGLVATRLGHLDEASDHFERALELTAASGDSGRTADVLTNLMGLTTRRGEHARTLEIAERARSIYRDRGDGGREGQLDLNVANVLVLEGRLSEAASHLEHALALSAEARDVRGQLQALLSLGRLAVVLRDPERWRSPLQHALGLADSLGDAYAQAATRNNLAVLALYDDDGGTARRLGHQALAYARAAADSDLVHDVAVTLGNIAFTARDTAAAGWYRMAEAAGREGTASVRASDLNNLGTAQVLAGRLEDAERQFHRALEAAETSGLVEWVWPPLLGLGEVAERRGDFMAALSFARRAATCIDTLRTRQAEPQAITLFARRLFAYEALIHLLGKLDGRFPDSAYAAEAFAWSERSRARALLDLVARWGESAGATAPLTLAQAQATLDRSSVLFEYSLGDSSSSLWVVTRDAMRRVALPPRAALRARVERLRHGLADPSQATSTRTATVAHELYRLLIQPAEPLLRGHRHVIVSPDGPLAAVPFEALRIRPPGPGNPVPGDYWVSRFDVSYTPSATMRVAHGAGGSADGMVALADPSYGDALSGRAPLPRLPDTAGEVAALRAVVGEAHVVALLGADATRTRLLGAGLARARLVHLATHGEVDEAEPARSGLWLAAEGGHPGFLSVSDVLDLRLDADLVTLSACETGVGRMERGEGVIGLARAFLAAGSRGVLVSLWKVNDRSTARLMTGFYRNLLSSGMPRDRALAEAKRALLRSRDASSPFHWAPFVLVGQSGALGSRLAP